MKFYTWMDHSENHVDSFKRFTALAIDWIFGYLCMAAPIAILWLYHTKDAKHMVSSISELGGKLNIESALLACIVSFIIAIIYYVLIPLRNDGQTYGKRIMGIKVVKLNDEPVDLKTLIIRQVIGLMFIEGYFSMISESMRQIFLLYGLSYVYIGLGAIAIVLSGISIFMSMKFASHRALHDYLANTKVVLKEDEGYRS